MTECPMATSSRERMLQQEMSAVRQQTDGKAEHGVVVPTMIGVGDNQVGQRHEPADTSMVDRGHAARETL